MSIACDGVDSKPGYYPSKMAYPISLTVESASSQRDCHGQNSVILHYPCNRASLTALARRTQLLQTIELQGFGRQHAPFDLVSSFGKEYHYCLLEDRQTWSSTIAQNSPPKTHIQGPAGPGRWCLHVENWPLFGMPTVRNGGDEITFTPP